MKSWRQPYGVQDEEKKLCWLQPAVPSHRNGDLCRKILQAVPCDTATRNVEEEVKSSQIDRYLYSNRYYTNNTRHRIDLHIDSDSLQEPISYKRRYKSRYKSLYRCDTVIRSDTCDTFDGSTTIDYDR